MNPHHTLRLTENCITQKDDEYYLVDLGFQVFRVKYVIKEDLLHKHTCAFQHPSETILKWQGKERKKVTNLQRQRKWEKAREGAETVFWKLGDEQGSEGDSAEPKPKLTSESVIGKAKKWVGITLGASHPGRQECRAHVKKKEHLKCSIKSTGHRSLSWAMPQSFPKPSRTGEGYSQPAILTPTHRDCTLEHRPGWKSILKSSPFSEGSLNARTSGPFCLMARLRAYNSTRKGTEHWDIPVKRPKKWFF